LLARDYFYEPVTQTTAPKHGTVAAIEIRMALGRVQAPIKAADDAKSLQLNK